MNFTTSGQRILYELFQQEFRDAVEGTDEARFFEIFASEQIMKPFDLSDEEIEKCVLGSGNDGGCDAIFVLHNGVIITEDVLEELGNSKNAVVDLVIVQAKRETSFSERTIMNWKTTSQNLLEIGVDDTIHTTRYSEDVRNSFAIFRELYVKLLRSIGKLNIKFYYASFADEVHPNVQSQANELIAIVKKLFPGPQISVSVDFWGADKLLFAAQRQPERKLSLPLAEAPINIGTHHDFVALVNLAKYYSFIIDEDGELRKYIFESNVRDYQGHNSVNQDIQNSLEISTGEDFWWLNNGITLLTEEASLATNKELVLKEPAVVNGLQTSNEIYRYFKQNPIAINTETRNILVRVIVPESEESRDKIILATNNQTNIPKSSLRANDPIHWQIELYFRGRSLYYDRRKNYYKNQGVKSNDIISVSFLAQCMISLLLQKPNYARARPSTLLTDDDAYARLYNQGADLDVFYNAALLGKKVETVLKKSQAYSQAEKNDILFYVIYYLVADMINKVEIGSDDVKSLDVSSISEDQILHVAQVVYSFYCSLGATGKVAKGSDLIELVKKEVEEKSEK